MPSGHSEIEKSAPVADNSGLYNERQIQPFYGIMKTSLILSGALVITTGGMIAAAALAVGKTREARQTRTENAALHLSVTSLNKQVETLRDQLQPRPAPAQPVAPALPPPPGDAEAGLAALLAEKDKEIAALREQLAEASRRPPEIREGLAAVTNRMQTAWTRLREDNPEEYDRIQRERRERREELASMTRERVEFIKSIPIDGLAQEYRDNHTALVARLEFFNQAAEQIAAEPDAQLSRELRGQLFENMRGMGDMLRMERDVLLTDLANEAGFKGDAARDFVESVHYIHEVTTPPGLSMLGFGRRGGSSRGGDSQPPPLPTPQ